MMALRRKIPTDQRFAVVDPTASPPIDDFDPYFDLGKFRDDWRKFNVDHININSNLEDAERMRLQSEKDRLDNEWNEHLNWALEQAQIDIEREIKIDFFDRQGYSAGYYNRTGAFLVTIGEEFDPELLNKDQWKRATVYRALGQFLYPQLIVFKNGETDSHATKANYWSKMFKEEYKAVLNSAIEYDYDDDGEIDEFDRFEVRDDLIVN